MIDYHLLPQFQPARLQDLVLWYEPASFRGNTWRNLAPSYTDRNHGTAYGGVGLSTWHPRANPIPEFYAQDDYIDLSLDVLSDDEMSIEIVFELYSNTDAGRVLGADDSRGDKYELRHWVNSSGNFRFYVGNGSYLYYTGFYINWYEKVHGVWTWKYDSGANRTTFKAYKNGEFSQSTNVLSKIALPNIWLRLAHWATAGMKGKIYMVRFYHKALSDDEIYHNYTHHPLYLLQRGIDPYMFVKRGGIYKV